MTDDFKCPRDTDGDGNCATCARLNGGCFEKPATDEIARLREAWEALPKDQWHTDNTEVLDNDENDILFIDTNHLSLNQDKAIAAFIALTHNDFGKILAVLEAVQAFVEIDDDDCTSEDHPDDDALEVLIAALSALKGGTS